ncbi:SseB family protein [Sphingobacterium puteale]|uniref:SseB family protein n=1 Tax=Sphingobacterium puteale TaxID=2420510 RepID=UPI003D98D577
MGLFDIFKKKKNISTFPENELERCLLRGTNNIEAQKEFYQKLLWSNLYILTMDLVDSNMAEQNPEKVTVKAATFEGGQVPIFTSINRIFDKGIVKEGKVNYIGIKGQDLFDGIKAATFVLNPYSEYCKEMKPAEIDDILNGSIYQKIDANARKVIAMEKFNEIFRRSNERQKDLIYLNEISIENPTSAEIVALESSITDFQECLSIVPHHWQSMFFMAKALQRLERHTEALEQFEAAFKIELENHFIPMEAATEAMHLKDLDKALFYSEESLKRNPNDIASMGNHAMNLLIALKDMEALMTIENAIKLAPHDKINNNIASIVRDVIAGKRQRPTFEEMIVVPSRSFS